MTTLATETQPDHIYRRTKSPWDGEYYTVPTTVHRGDLIDRLKRKTQRKGREEHLLRHLRKGWVLMRRHLRYRDDRGRRTETTDYVAVPTDYRFRAVKTKPGYTKKKETKNG